MSGYIIVEPSYYYINVYYDPNIYDPQWPQWVLQFSAREYSDYALPSEGAPIGPYGFPELYLTTESYSELQAFSKDSTILSGGVGAQTETNNSGSIWYEWEGGGQPQGGTAYYYVEHKCGIGPMYNNDPDTQAGYATTGGQTDAFVEMDIASGFAGNDSGDQWVDFDTGGTGYLDITDGLPSYDVDAVDTTPWEVFTTDTDRYGNVWYLYDWGWSIVIFDTINVDPGETLVSLDLETYDATSVYSELYEYQNVRGINNVVSELWSFLLMVPDP